eukprot:CAMPEP_0172487158 /NCGR_PEP_ID=MMETSP1066-20121228/16091_1 /TAXON_ID=671091 /ORGANISM="Coscinodiscus wailesii, Strain CCMP2513" /LENGTH=482 /DNA_ID=CAMNT_0013253585 /DNA_START=131 /DNA_END=1579 /DNA_ORIENTATION=-
MINKAYSTFSKERLPIVTQKKSLDEGECLRSIAIELNNVGVELYESNELVYAKEVYKNAAKAIMAMIQHKENRAFESSNTRMDLIEQVIDGKQRLYQLRSTCAGMSDTDLGWYEWLECECDSCVSPMLICKAIKIDTGCVEGSDDVNFVNAAIISYNLGLVHMKEKEYDTCGQIFELGIGLRQAIDDSNESLRKSMVFCNLLNNLGCIHYKRNNMCEADACLIESVRIGKCVVESRGDASLLSAQRCVGAIFYNIGVMKACLGLYKKVDHAFECCLEMLKSAFGSDHLLIGAIQKNIGVVYFEMGRLNDAMEAFLHGLNLMRLVKGDNHPDTARVLFYLGNVHRTRCEYEEALQVYNRSLDIERRNLGSSHPDTIAILCEIGNIHHSKGDLDKSIRIFDEALVIAKSRLECDSRYKRVLIKVLCQLIRMNIEDGRIDEGMKYHVELMNEMRCHDSDQDSIEMFDIAHTLEFVARLPAAAAAA